MTLYTVLWYFFIYAFLGWCTEVAFFAVKKGEFVNRGFLNGPVCPIYGFGVSAIIIILTPLSDNLLLLFIGSVILTSAIEYLTGWALKKLFHTRWWDYSENKFNLNGYICLQFSLAWGFAATFVMKIIQPMISGVVEAFPKFLGVILLAVFLVLILTDLVATVSAVRNMQKSLRIITAMANDMHSFSEKIGERVSYTANSVKEQAEETADRYSPLAEMRKAHREEEQELLRNHRKEEQELLENILAEEKELLGVEYEQRKQDISEKVESAKKKYSRFVKAFPDLYSEGYQEALDKIKKHGK